MTAQDPTTAPPSRYLLYNLKLYKQFTVFVCASKQVLSALDENLPGPFCQPSADRAMLSPLPSQPLLAERGWRSAAPKQPLESQCHHGMGVQAQPPAVGLFESLAVADKLGFGLVEQGGDLGPCAEFFAR
ncbi:hypothetical protein Thiosp_01432 [Thiorhodovibrio litoralis]|nr:hypothetical protein Thiosp_01432 [Thiorhodovibrio litoralis]